MTKIVDDVGVAAAWIQSALSSSGYQANWSAESLREVDRFFDAHSRAGKAVPGGLLSEQLGSRIFALGAYVGEVIRRAVGGQWVGDDSDPSAEINVELQLVDGTRCWPVQRVMKRFKLGQEEGIAAYAAGLGVRRPASSDNTSD